MCGICGFAPKHHDHPVDEAMLRRMAAILRHRGPDSEGFYVGAGIGLGVRRLSIIDIETGDQPIANEDGAIVVICNGEIYNFQELRQELISRGHRFRTRSDTEVIVHLYEDLGADGLRHLRGMFAFALWDSARRRLMLARDRLGIKPLHYAATARGLYFASESKSILAADGLPAQVHAEALWDLFTFGYVVAPHTLFSGISRLLPGHYLIYEDGGFSEHCYWRPSFPKDGAYRRDWDADDHADALLDKLRETVRLHMRSDVEVGAWLSAGIDSSSVACLMREHSRRPIRTFTLGFQDPGADEVARQKTLDRFPGYDLAGSRAVCRDEDFGLFPKALWHCEEPFTAAAEVPRMVLSRLSASLVKVVLTGEGSDEILGGYEWYKADKFLRPFCRLPLALRRAMTAVPFFRRRWPGACSVLLAPPLMDQARYTRLGGMASSISSPRRFFQGDFQRAWTQAEAKTRGASPGAEYQNWHPFLQLQYYDLTMRLPDAIVHHLDRTSMAYSLEARVPFLDHELVEFCAGIPPAFKMKGYQEKYILRRAMRGLLPAEVLRRKKHPMTAPFPQWFRRDLPDFAEDLLSRDRLRKKGYFDPEAVLDLLKKHRQRQGNFGKMLLGILGVQLWDEIFLRGNKSEI